MGNYQSQLYLLKDVKEHQCENCKTATKKTCDANMEEELLVNSLDEVYEDHHHKYKQHEYQIRECPSFFQNVNTPGAKETKITVDVGYQSRLHKALLGKILYSSDVNMHAVGIREIDREYLACHPELGQASAGNLTIMYKHKDCFGTLFKDVTPESLKRCHLFVRNTGPMNWGERKCFGDGHFTERRWGYSSGFRQFRLFSLNV